MYNIALVGVAHIHTPGFIHRLKVRSAEMSVKAVWDHDAARAAATAAELGAVAVADVEAIWADPTITAVVVCSETNRQQDLATAAAAAGKHLFVEKPLGMAAKDAWVMADAIERARVIFQTGYFMRSEPIHRFLRDEIAKGHLGKITRARHSNCHHGSLGGWFDGEYRWMAEPAVAGVGAYGDLGTHSLDILIWLLGDVTSVTADIRVATGRYGDCDEYGEGLMQFASGAIGTMAAGWVDVANPVRLIVSGTEGHAVMFHDTLYYTSKHVDGADGKTPWTTLPEPLPHAFDLYLDALLGKDVPLVSVREAAYRTTVMETLYKSAKAHCWLAPDGK